MEEAMAAIRRALSTTSGEMTLTPAEPRTSREQAGAKPGNYILGPFQYLRQRIDVRRGRAWPCVSSRPPLGGWGRVPRARTVKSSLTKPTQVVNQSESSSLGWGIVSRGWGIVSNVVRERHSLMFRPRSYMAFAITPQPPIVDWLSALDASLGRSESFFAGQHVALDLSAVNLSSNAIGQLVSNLEERAIRVLGIEGVDPASGNLGFPLSFGATASREPLSPFSSLRPLPRRQRPFARPRKGSSQPH